MQRKEIFIGIDVSKETLDVAHYSTKNHIRIANSSEGLKLLLAWLKKLDISLEECWFLFEYTGGYEYRLVQFCASRSITFTRVSGLEIKKSLGMQRGKNDKIDAKRIAQYGYEKRERIQSQNPCSAALTRLKAMLTQRKAFVNEKKAHQHRLNELIAMMDLKKNDPLIKYYRQGAACAEKMITKIEVQIEKLIKKEEALLKNFKFLTSITGIGNVNAWMAIAYTENFTRFSNGRKFGAYCGVVPYDHESGKSIKGKSRISHMANKDIKADLFMAAKASVGYDPEIRAYYQKREKMGKHHMSIMNAVKFKLILRMFAVVNKQEDYVKKSKIAA
jgi:transposase